jgi:hypothetical protein
MSLWPAWRQIISFGAALLLGTAPAEPLVKGAGPGKLGDAERYQADPLFHRGNLPW